MRHPERWIAATVLLLLVAAVGRDSFDLWVDKTGLPPLTGETSAEVLDRNGEMLRVYTAADGRWRLEATPEQVDADYIRMLLAYEDRRFFRHSGVDVLALIRAVGQAVRNGRVVSGGSTLTMQVARLLEHGGTGRVRGKLRQIRVALALERRLSKQQILALYLTHAPFGGNLEGVRAAALAWFGKEPTRLTPAQAALLIALPQAPEARRPDRQHAAAVAARGRVLARMQAAGMLSSGAVNAARSEPVPAQRRPFPALAPHLADRAIGAAPAAVRYDLTLDKALQKSLEKLAGSASRTLPPGVSVAVVVADHQSGEILASVGSAGFTEAEGRQGFVDMTQAVRSPGSTLKPLIYAMAFDRGLAHPGTLIDDRPVAFGPYAPQNFDGAFRGQLTVAEALRQSLNIPAVLLMDEIGPAHLMDTLRRAGTEPKLPAGRAGLAVALGGVGMTLQDLVQLYAMLANGGSARPLYWRMGNTRPCAGRVLSRSAAWQVADILSGLTPPPGAPPKRIAYKTGTSYGHRDALAIGFDGRYVAGVWIGRPDGTPVPGAFGGALAAPLLFEALQRLGQEPVALPPPPPETLIVSTAELPQPLRRFTGRRAVFQPAPDAPKLIFPPDGARLALDGGALTVKLRDGAPPFTWLADGTPLRTGVRRRETTLPVGSVGFSTLTVIDARGRTARTTVQLD